jgi:hypothetical protein
VQVSLLKAVVQTSLLERIPTALGGALSPIFSTLIVTHRPRLFALGYLLPAVMGALNGLYMMWTYRFKTCAQILGPLPVVSGAPLETTHRLSLGKKVWQVLKRPKGLALCLYLLMVVSVEFGVGGWLVRLPADTTRLPTDASGHSGHVSAG